MMNAIKFESTRYGYKANVEGLVFHIRRVNLPTEPGCYVVYSKDWDENFCGDLVEARQWLNGIAVGYADAVGL